MFPQLWRVSTGIHIVRKEKYSHCFRSPGSNCRLDGWRPPRKFRSGIRHEIPKAESFNRHSRERTRLDLFPRLILRHITGRLRNVIYVKGAVGSEEFLNFVGGNTFSSVFSEKVRVASEGRKILWCNLKQHGYKRLAMLANRYFSEHTEDTRLCKLPQRLSLISIELRNYGIT